MKSVRFASRIILAASLMLLGACAAPPRAPDGTSAEARIERVDRIFALQPDITRVAIDNPWGEINVRGHDRHEVGMHAVVQRLAPRFAAARFETRREGTTLHIDVRIDGAEGPDTDPAAGHVDVAMYVPTRLALAMGTHDGRISAKKREGAIEAHSRSGEIRASSLGRLQLRTESGPIRAMAIGARWPGASEIGTDSGRIVLLVPTFGDIALDARTGGGMRTGFGLSVHALEGGGHEAHARYGAGTSPLRARSRTGEIVLEQLVLLGHDKQLPEDDD